MEFHVAHSSPSPNESSTIGKSPIEQRDYTLPRDTSHASITLTSKDSDVLSSISAGLSAACQVADTVERTPKEPNKYKIGNLVEESLEMETVSGITDVKKKQRPIFSSPFSPVGIVPPPISLPVPSVTVQPLTQSSTAVSRGQYVANVIPHPKVASPNSVPVKKRSAFRAELDTGSEIGNVKQKVFQSTNLSGTILNEAYKDGDFSKGNFLPPVSGDKKLSHSNIGNTDGHKSLYIKDGRGKLETSLKEDKLSLSRTDFGDRGKCSERRDESSKSDSHPLNLKHYKDYSESLQEIAEVEASVLVRNSNSPQGEELQKPGENEDYKTSHENISNLSHQNGERNGMNILSTSRSSEYSSSKKTEEVAKTFSAGTEESKVEIDDHHPKVGSPKQGHGLPTSAQSQQSGYLPMYLPSSCHVTLERETQRVPRDGSKVHATTFIPALGEFIPGPASSTREPVSRNKNSGLSSHSPKGSDEQLSPTGGYGPQKDSGKTGIPKESHKRGSKHAGHADVGSPKQSKREGKKSPWPSRPSSTKLHSPSGFCDLDSKSDRRTDMMDSFLRKAKDTGMSHPGELSIITQQYGYQPLLAIGTSPPSQRSNSSMSPMDRKNTESKTTDIDRQRQLLEWQMAAASQHGYFYDPQHLWSPTGFGTARTSMITSHANTLSTQESVLRAALVGPGSIKSAGSSLSSPAMTTASSSSSKMSSECSHKRNINESGTKSIKTVSGKSLGDMNLGHGTSSGKSSDMGTRHPPVGIALAQQRLETEKRSSESSQNSSRERHEERSSSRHREPSRGSFSPSIQRDSRSAESHREPRVSSNPSHTSHQNPNLAVTRGVSSSHHSDLRSHPSPFPTFPHCYSHLPPGHGNPSQPFWLSSGFGLPTSHSSSPLPSGYQDITLPGSLGLPNLESPAGRQIIGMFPPHLPGAESGLHGLGWFQPWLPPPALHHLQQLGGVNPSLLAQFPHLGPPGSSPLNQPLHLLTGQSDQRAPLGSDQRAPLGSEMHALLQQQEAFFQWYRQATELQSRQHQFYDDRLRRESSPLHSHVHRCSETPSKQSSKGDRSESSPDKKSVKSESQHESCRQSPGDPEKLTAHQPIIPPFMNSVAMPPGPHMPLFYPPHLPYLLDPPKRHDVHSHSPTPQPKVERKDAGTNSHSPAGVCATTSDNRHHHKSEPKDIKNSSLKSACVQTSPSVIMENDITNDKGDEERSKVKEPEMVKRTDSSEQTIDVIVVDENVDSEKNDAQKLKEMTETVIDYSLINVRSENEVIYHPLKKSDSLTEDLQKTKSIELVDDSQQTSVLPPASTEKHILSEATVKQPSVFEKESVKLNDSIVVTSPSSGYTGNMDCQSRESLITSIMTTTQSVASKMEGLDQEQLAAIEGIALLSEVAEQKTFAAFCAADKADTTSDSGQHEEPSTNDNKDIGFISEDSSSNVQSPHQPQDLSVSINTVELEMKLKLAELQRKYKEKKKELDKLQRKKDKKERLTSIDETEMKKRGPGRPRKNEKDVDGQKKVLSKDNTLQSSAAVLLEAAASLESSPPPPKKKKKEKRKEKMKSKRESLEELDKEIKELKRKKKKQFKRRDIENLVPLKPKKKKKYSGISWPPPPLSSSTKKKISSKSGEKKKKSSKVKSPSSPLPSIFSSTIPVFDKIKPKLPISHVYGDSSDSEEENSSQMSFDMVMPKGLALLASTAELSSGHSTPVKKPTKKLKEQNKPKKSLKEKTSPGGKKKQGESPSVTKKIKVGKKRDKTKSFKEEKKCKREPKKESSSQDTVPKFDEEIWSRRRSERIFLNDSSPIQSRDVSPISKPNENGKFKVNRGNGSPGKVQLEMPKSSPSLSNIGTVLDALKTDPSQMRQKFSKMSASDLEDNASSVDSQEMRVKKKVGRKKKFYKIRFGSLKVDTEEDEESGEDLPLSSFVDRPGTPPPRPCNIKKDELNEGQRVLVPIDNLFYEGKIHPIQPPDVYGVILDGRRANRPLVYSQEQILQEAIADVKPPSCKYLPEGTRICAYWSQQYSCLYPGTVVKGSPRPSSDSALVCVEFDDGDSGRIPLSHIRMLPQDYPVVELEPSLVTLQKKRKRRMSESSSQDESKEDDDDEEEVTKDKKNAMDDGDDDVFLPSKPKRGRKPSAKTIAARKALLLQGNCLGLATQETPVKKGRGRPRKIQPGNQPVSIYQSKPKLGRPPKKPISSSINLAKKINKLYAAGRKKKQLEKMGKIYVKGSRPRGRPPGSKKGMKVKKMKSQSCTVETETIYSSEVMDPAQAAMVRYDGADESEDARTTAESETWSEDESPKKNRGARNSSSKMAAFLPDRQLWRWLGNSTQRKGSKGKAKKVFYKAIVRGKEVIRVNECAVFLSTGRPHLPYVGRIESMWESWGGIMVVKVKWFYHPEETKGGGRRNEGKMALYQSPHVDENDVQTISHKCEVLSREEYNLRASGKIPKNSIIDNDDVYYLAGTYDPTNGRMATFP